MAPDFSTLTNAIDLTSVVVPLLFVFAGFAGIYVILLGARLILERLGSTSDGRFNFLDDD